MLLHRTFQKVALVISDSLTFVSFFHRLSFFLFFSPFSLLPILQLSFLPLAFKFVLSSVLIRDNVYSLLLEGNKPNPVADFA